MLVHVIAFCLCISLVFIWCSFPLRFFSCAFTSVANLGLCHVFIGIRLFLHDWYNRCPFPFSVSPWCMVLLCVCFWGLDFSYLVVRVRLRAILSCGFLVCLLLLVHLPPSAFFVPLLYSLCVGHTWLVWWWGVSPFHVAWRLSRSCGLFSLLWWCVVPGLCVLTSVPSLM